MKNSGLLAFIGGAVAGAAAALLLAPKSGEQTRKEMKDIIDEHISYAKEKCAKFRAMHEQMHTQMQEQLQENQAPEQQG